ncbi:MAG TPA: AmmeMemoRadiSam system radical SAM enzyme [Armatimonadota bacterium]|nr:AmmeMemoRadiSam system radical SAM enzyme [Armatimonadota bacterium]
MRPNRDAMYWSTEGDRVRCALCPHRCLIAEGKAGICTVRANQGGKLVPLTYGRVGSVHLDPIEKKPLYHFHPGKSILSLGSWGCNLSCDFCQNWQISMDEAPTREMSSDEAVALAAREKSRGENIGIAFTYNEPLVWFEYILDTAKLGHEHGLVNAVVTNGEIEEAPLQELLPHLDALNVDVKAMADEFYRGICSGPSEPPRRTVELAYASGTHVEITNLLIPGENDSEGQIRELVDWIAGVSDRIPVHFSRYHPAYKMTNPPTPTETLARAYAIAGEKLKYVYVGNAQMPGMTDTNCPECKAPLVARDGMYEARCMVKAGNCPSCGIEADIVT